MLKITNYKGQLSESLLNTPQGKLNIPDTNGQLSSGYSTTGNNQPRGKKFAAAFKQIVEVV